MKKNIRVVIPRSAEKLIALAQQIIKQHIALGDNSPLRELNMAAFDAVLRIAIEHQEKALLLRKQSEEATETRNLALGFDASQTSSTEGSVLYFTTAAKDILLGLNRGNEQKLGNYGYEVNSSPRKGDEPEDEATTA